MASWVDGGSGSPDYVNQFVAPSTMLIASIVGMPNSGKSSLFNLLTNEAVSTDSNLYCTIGLLIITLFLNSFMVYACF